MEVAGTRLTATLRPAEDPELVRRVSDAYGTSPDAGSTLHRWTIDPATGKVTTESLNDLATEFPSINEAHTPVRRIATAKPSASRERACPATTPSSSTP